MADTIACNNCGTVQYEDPSGDTEKPDDVAVTICRKPRNTINIDLVWCWISDS